MLHTSGDEAPWVPAGLAASVVMLVAIAAREGEFTALQNSLRGLGQKIETVTYEIDAMTAQEAEGVQKRTALTVWFMNWKKAR